MQTLLTEQQLKEGVHKMATDVNACYGGQPMTIIAILTGSVVLLADLIRMLQMPLRVGVLQARSYHGAATTRGELIINDELLPDIEGRDVLLVDDIFDTGHTLREVISRIKRLGPSSVRSAVLLYKEGRREADIEPDFVGFRIPNEFVVGYGLDYQDEFRNLPHLAVLDEEDLKEG
ncbi:MAG: hypoxanthine phosphoribosyltransferase [Planctomycetales bacterium]